MKKQLGFSLVELMTVIVIIGALAALGLPNYQTYTIRSRMAEAYPILGTIAKNETTYYYENKEFYDLTDNPSTLNVPMLIGTNSSWSTVGYPSPVGSNVNFSYRARAGKTDGSGTELTTSTVNGNGFADLSTNTILSASYTAPSAVTCNAALATPSSLGVPSQNSYNWVIVAAVADLKKNLDTTCTSISLIVDVTNETPGSRGGLVQYNVGE